MFGLKRKKEAAKSKKRGKAQAKTVEKSKDSQAPVPEKLTDKQIDARVDEGEIHTIITFEIVGKPKTHIEAALKQYLANIKKDGRIDVLSEDYAEAIEQEDGMFSTYCEAEMLITGMTTLVWLAVNFSPASIEILGPEKKEFSASEISAWLNDLLSRLHEASTELRGTNMKNKTLNTSMNALINNFIISILEHEELDTAGLQKRMGIHKDQLAPFLKHLLEQERITQKKGIYSAK